MKKNEIIELYESNAKIYGDVKWNGQTYDIITAPAIDYVGGLELPEGDYFTALCIDSSVYLNDLADDVDFTIDTVYWAVLPDWDGEDYSTACDWDNPVTIEMSDYNRPYTTFSVKSEGEKRPSVLRKILEIIEIKGNYENGEMSNHPGVGGTIWYTDNGFYEFSSTNPDLSVDDLSDDDLLKVEYSER